MKNLGSILLIFFCLFGLWGCATIGEPFQFSGPEKLVVGKTTKAEVLKQYGDPFRVGFDDGDLKWTYGFYKYSLFGSSDTKDLAITFDKNGLVKDYTYSTSLEDEKNQILQRQML
jgi:hypothetical protein